MATFTFDGYMGAGPAWADFAANRIVFSGSLTDLTAAITVAAFQDGTHAGNGTPGTDQCGANHANNVKYLTGSTMSVNGAGSEAINDTNLAEIECSLRVHFSHGSAVAISGARLYAFDNSVVTNEAVGIDMYAFERGVAATAWTLINDDSGNIGGDNAGERLALGDKTSATDHYWYIALSASPESVGAKASFAIGCALTYS
ncbi:MAG TPA: hypothetical protein VI729_01755 [Anaerolineales bacterium]|nr:hypothetical protein [Anaerolineales bacterium]